VPSASSEAIARVPRQVLLVRHGATQWSRDGRHTGRTDLPLLPEGETEARALQGKLEALLGERGPARVLCSPLARAQATCRLAGYGDRMELDSDLMEWDYGAYEGRTTPQIQAERPGWELFRDGCPGGESAADVAARVRRVIAGVRADPALEGASVLVVAHGHVLRMLASIWAGFGDEGGRSLPLETGAVSVLGWAHEYAALARWNL